MLDNIEIKIFPKNERPEDPDISSGTYNFKKAKKEGKKAKHETLKGF